MNDEFIDELEEAEPDTSEVEARLRELGIRLDPSIPYRLDTMFPRLKGWGAKGEIKKKGKLIEQVEPTLHNVLLNGEEVLYVAKGVQQSFFEMWFMGALWSAMINQTVFVLTNARIIMLRSDGKGKPQHTFWMIYYSEIKKFKRSWLGSLTLKLHDGRNMAFGGFTKTDGTAMPTIFEEALETYRQRGFRPQTTQSLENLCSHCFARVPKHEYECEQCDQEFWSPMQVALRSLIFPSWGDFLLGHTALAWWELLGYVISWFVIVTIALAEMQRGQLVVSVFFAGMVILIEHVVDAFVTYFVARKGLHPRK